MSLHRIRPSALLLLIPVALFAIDHYGFQNKLGVINAIPTLWWLLYALAILLVVFFLFFIPGTVGMIRDFRSTLSDFNTASLGQKLICISFCFFAAPFTFVLWRLFTGLWWWRGEMIQTIVLFVVAAVLLIVGLILWRQNSSPP